MSSNRPMVIPLSDSDGLLYSPQSDQGETFQVLLRPQEMKGRVSAGISELANISQR
jgi:hypothetical protein